MKPNNVLNYKGYSGSIECSIEDDCLHGKVLFIEDIVTYEGDTPSALKTAFEGAIDRYLAYCEKTGKPANKAYSGGFNVRISPDLHRQVAIAASKSGVTLNECVKRALEAYLQSLSTSANRSTDKLDERISAVESVLLYGDTREKTKQFIGAWGVLGETTEGLAMAHRRAPSSQTTLTQGQEVSWSSVVTH